MRHRRPSAAGPSAGARCARAHGRVMSVLTCAVCTAGCGGRFLGYGVSTVIERDCPRPREHIIGRALMGFWPLPPFGPNRVGFIR